MVLNVMIHTLQEYLGDFKQRFMEKRASRITEKLKNTLHSVSGDIEVRNRDVDMEYTLMLPEKIPNSITEIE